MTGSSVNHSRTGRFIAAALAAGMAVAPLVTHAQRAGAGSNNPVRDVPVTGHLVSDPTRLFEGTFSIQRFERLGDQIVAVGELKGTLPDGRPVNRQSVAIPLTEVNGVSLVGAQGASLQRGVKAVPATYDPARAPTIVKTQATCPVLDLSLGPLDLDLLGLVVHLDEVNLTIDAQQGSGNLLGNLLCAVTGLLDPLDLGGLTTLLNQIVNILNGIVAGL